MGLYSCIITLAICNPFQDQVTLQFQLFEGTTMVDGPCVREPPSQKITLTLQISSTQVLVFHGKLNILAIPQLYIYVSKGKREGICVRSRHLGNAMNVESC